MSISIKNKINNKSNYDILFKHLLSKLTPDTKPKIILLQNLLLTKMSHYSIKIENIFNSKKKYNIKDVIKKYFKTVIKSVFLEYNNRTISNIVENNRDFYEYNYDNNDEYMSCSNYNNRGNIMTPFGTVVDKIMTNNDSRVFRDGCDDVYDRYDKLLKTYKIKSNNNNNIENDNVEVSQYDKELIKRNQDLNGYMGNNSSNFLSNYNNNNNIDDVIEKERRKKIMEESFNLSTSSEKKLRSQMIQTPNLKPIEEEKYIIHKEPKDEPFNDNLLNDTVLSTLETRHINTFKNSNKYNNNYNKNCSIDELLNRYTKNKEEKIESVIETKNNKNIDIEDNKNKIIKNIELIGIEINNVEKLDNPCTFIVNKNQYVIENINTTNIEEILDIINDNIKDINVVFKIIKNKVNIFNNLNDNNFSIIFTCNLWEFLGFKENILKDKNNYSASFINPFFNDKLYIHLQGYSTNTLLGEICNYHNNYRLLKRYKIDNELKYNPEKNIFRITTNRDSNKENIKNNIIYVGKNITLKLNIIY